MFDPFTILAALIPTVQYGIQRIIDYKTGGPKPTNAAEAIALKQADVAQLEALGKLDNADGASRWVINIRGLQRPVATAVILGMWSIYAYRVGITAEDMQNMAAAAVFYLFGDRTAMYISGNRKR